MNAANPPAAGPPWPLWLLPLAAGLLPAAAAVIALLLSIRLDLISAC